MPSTEAGLAGARFFDEKKRDRGWATQVTKRVLAVGKLTVLDVTTAEPSLASFLTALDKSALRVEHADLAAESYTFLWASGYQNGLQIRIQGVLVGA